MAFVKDQWWLVDDSGRKIGWLWPEDFEAILESHFGPRAWVDSFALYAGIHRSQIDRYRHGKTPIPKHISVLVSQMASLRNSGVPLTEIQAPWLPETTSKKGRQGTQVG